MYITLFYWKFGVKKGCPSWFWVQKKIIYEIYITSLCKNGNSRPVDRRSDDKRLRIWIFQVMLVTSWCCWLEIGGNFWILVSELRYWWHLLNLGARPSCQKIVNFLVTNISKLSPTPFVFNIRHQHRCNLFSMVYSQLSIMGFGMVCLWYLFIGTLQNAIINSC